MFEDRLEYEYQYRTKRSTHTADWNNWDRKDQESGHMHRWLSDWSRYHQDPTKGYKNFEVRVRAVLRSDWEEYKGDNHNGN